MSSLKESLSKAVDHLQSDKEPDYTSFIRRLREQPEKSNVSSLKAMTGRYLVEEAHLFFEELQADLSSIKIQGDNVDELWCLLDWHRYILAIWAEQVRKATMILENRWVDITQSLETILKATVSLNRLHALPSKNHQRSALGASDNSLSFERSIHVSDGPRNHPTLNEKDLDMLQTLVAATCEGAWATPLVHEAAFTGIIDSVMDTLVEARSRARLQMHHHSGLESAEFRGFIRTLEHEIKLLISFSPAKEQDELYIALYRALRAALLKSDYHDIRYVQFYHSFLSTWPLNNEELQLEVDKDFQNRVQDIFGRVIAPTTFSRYLRSAPYNIKDLEDILALGADVRGQVNGRIDNPLWAAAGKESSIHLFKALVHAGAPYKNERYSNSSPLDATAEAGHLDIVAFLLTSEEHHFDIDINHGDRERRTALHSASERCRKSVVGLLMQQPKIDLNPRDADGFTPFQLAVAANAKRPEKFATIMKFIQNKSVKVGYRARGGENALHLAASSRDATLKTIIKHVQGINDQNFIGNTPLHRAVRFNSRPNIELLLKHGADPTIMNVERATPLLLACEELHLGPMQVLLSLPHSLTYQCPTPIRLAKCYSGSHEHVSPVTFVLRDLNGAEKKRLAHIGLALKVILAAKPDLEVRDSNGRSVLSRVVQTASEAMLEDLLQAGADVNSQDDSGRTPLHMLMFSDDRVCSDKVEILLDWGADPNCQDMYGRAAIPADWERRYKRDIVKVIKQYKAEKARLKQEEDLRALAEQTKAYVMEQKQKNIEK